MAVGILNFGLCWAILYLCHEFVPTYCVIPEDSKSPSFPYPILSSQRRSDDSLVSAPLKSECPELCRCEYGGVEVTCNRVGLTGVPENIPASATILTITRNNISNVNSGSFSKLENLEVLTMVGNNIERVEPTAFRLLPKLGLLDLGDNNLGINLTDSVFRNLSRLSALNLSRNSLTRLENDFFEGLNKLTALDLSWNNVEHIGEFTFIPLVSLESLDLSHNRIRNLSDVFFNSLDSLKKLTLSENQINNIRKYIFQNLTSLQYLDLARNNLSELEPGIFEGLSNLNELYLENNFLVGIHQEIFKPIGNLEILMLSVNPIKAFGKSPFLFNVNLKHLHLVGLQNLNVIHSDAFAGLSSLTNLTLANNSALRFIQPHSFHPLTSLQNLDLSNNDLLFLHEDVFQGIKKLKQLDLSKNPWVCNCHLKWLPSWLNLTNVTLIQPSDLTCAGPDDLKGSKVLDSSMHDLNCSKPIITSASLIVQSRMGATALLECQAVGNPQPSVTWVLPRHHVFHWYPSDVEAHWSPPYLVDHPSVHGHNRTKASTDMTPRIKVLNNGNLYISRVKRVDAGMYLCLASNSMANETVYISLSLNYQILLQVKLISILVGLATSVALLLLLLIFQLISMALNRWGCCCCQGIMSPKAKQAMKILEGIETYKTQQLDRLRDNYTMQVQRIKDNCTQQMERIREGYGTQSDRLRDIRDYGTHQLDRVRDQYYEQVKRVRDYSFQQMNKVRENYIVQRNRIRKFSAHQLIRLRENYKLQQQHLNKILETLNIENCRTGSSRTESIFDPDEHIDLSADLPTPYLTREKALSPHSDEDSSYSGYFTPDALSNARSRPPSPTLTVGESPTAEHSEFAVDMDTPLSTPFETPARENSPLQSPSTENNEETLKFTNADGQLKFPAVEIELDTTRTNVPPTNCVLADVHTLACVVKEGSSDPSSVTTVIFSPNNATKPDDSKETCV